MPLNKRWYQKRVKRLEKWTASTKKDISFTEAQIKFWEEMKEFHKTTLKEYEEWLEEAKQDLDNCIKAHTK